VATTLAVLAAGKTVRGAQQAGAPAAVPAPTAPGPVLQENALYRKDCRRCHGADGKGLKRQRLSEIPDFADAAWQASREDADLHVSILEGKGKHMPPFGHTIGEDEVRALVTYVRAFAGRPPAPKVVATDFDRRFRQLEAEMRELIRQFEEVSAQAPRATGVKSVPASRGNRPTGGDRRAGSLRSGYGG
jgi:mono/diheme cytochrome c family protein